MTNTQVSVNVVRYYPTFQPRVDQSPDGTYDWPAVQKILNNQNGKIRVLGQTTDSYQYAIISYTEDLTAPTFCQTMIVAISVGNLIPILNS